MFSFTAKILVNLDHHQQPSDYAAVTYSDTEMSSTCEMVYHFIAALDGEELITSGMASSLYTGIMTDTGSFRFRSTTATTHRVIATLIDKGANNSSIHDDHQFQKGDTEGFVNYCLSLQGIIFAVIFIENQKDKIIKMSLRSKGDFSVNEFARAHYQGGGHTNAAGGKSDLNIEETVSQFKTLLPKYNEQLTL